MEKHIAVIPGDGIGPEIVKEAVKVLDVIAKKYGHRFVYTEVDAGGCAIDKYGTSLPKESLDAALGQGDLGLIAGGSFFSLQGTDDLPQLVQGGVDLPFGLQKFLFGIDHALPPEKWMPAAWGNGQSDLTDGTMPVPPRLC